MNKYKAVGRGWHGQSYRHYLAAKGIKSKYDYFAKMYHGTSKDRAELIDKEGLNPSFFSTSVEQAKYFGQDHGDPVIYSADLDENNLFAVDWATGEKRKISFKDVDSLKEDEYVFFDRKLPPENLNKYNSKNIPIEVRD